MRLSSIETDPGYQPYLALMSKGLTVDVALDGNPLKHCITADANRGEAVVYAISDGKALLSATGEVDTITLRGKIEFTIRRIRVAPSTAH